MVKASDHDLERLRLHGSVGNPIPLGKGCEVHLNALGCQRTNTAPERTKSIDLLVVQGDRDVLTIPETASDQLGQDSTRTDFDEVRHA